MQHIILDWLELSCYTSTSYLTWESSPVTSSWEGAALWEGSGGGGRVTHRVACQPVMPENLSTVTYCRLHLFMSLQYSPVFAKSTSVGRIFGENSSSRRYSWQGRGSMMQGEQSHEGCEALLLPVLPGDFDSLHH